MYRTLTRTAFLTLLILVFLPLIPAASEFLSGEGSIVGKSKTIDDDAYIFSDFAEVYGIIDGDLSAFCYEIDADGDIRGNSNIFAYRIYQGGQVEKSVRLFGWSVHISGEIGKNLLVFGKDIEIEKGTVIKRDLSCAGGVIRIEGDIQGDMCASADIIYISGLIDGNVEIEAKEIFIESPAVINGNIWYTSPAEAEIDDDVFIGGETEWNVTSLNEEIEKGVSLFFAAVRLLLFAMTLVTGLALILLFRNHTRESSEQVEKKFWHTLAAGILALIVFTFGALVLCAVIVGIPLAILLVSLGLLLFYIGKIYVAIALGRLIFRLIASRARIAIGWEFIVGLIILSIVFQIPFIGPVVYIVSFIVGTGAAITGFLSLNRKLKEATAGTSPAKTV